MSDECEITGFTPQQQLRWPLVHKHLCKQLELPNGDAIPAEALQQLSQDIEDVLKAQSPNKSALKKRNGLYEHLKRSIEKR